MKKILMACVVSIMGLTVPASAEYCCPTQNEWCSAPDFNGFYVGGNVGVFTNTSHRNDYDGFFPFGGTRTTNTTNATAGVLIGYDWHCCNKLLGLVADWNWVNNKSTITSTSSIESLRESFDWFSTIRGRAGITFCDSLVYVTLGAAALRYDLKGSGIASFHSDNTRWGWVGGVGTEFWLGCNWTLGAEILLLNFSNRNANFTAAGIPYTVGHSDTAYVGRVILNYRFGNLFCF